MSLIVGKSYFRTASNGMRILLRGPLDTAREIWAGFYANRDLGHYDHAVDLAAAKQQQMQATLLLMRNDVATYDWAYHDEANRQDRRW